MGISLRETTTIISSDIARLLLESILAGFEDYFNKVDEESRAICSATTRANFINDHMIYHARDKMKNHPDVRFITRYGRIHLIISESLEIKLKKLNRNRRPSNILTQEVKDYNDQIPLNLPRQLEFQDMLNPITNLIAGYQMNSLKTGVEAVYIVCPQGSLNRWEWKLDFVAKPIMIPEHEQIIQPREPKVVIPKNKTVIRK